MDTGFSKQRHNPIKLMEEWWPDADLLHIEYDPEMTKGEYQIIRESGGDGTMLFTIQMLQATLLPLVNMSSVFKPKRPKDLKQIKAIKYKIGPLKHAQVFGMIYLRSSKTHKYPGQKERARISIISDIVFHSTSA